jgi:hypothetical protein
MGWIVLLIFFVWLWRLQEPTKKERLEMKNKMYNHYILSGKYTVNRYKMGNTYDHEN